MEIKNNKGNRKERNMSLETYIINKKTLLKLIQYAQKISSFFNLRDTLAYLCDERKIMAYEYKGFARCIDSYEAYYKGVWNSLIWIFLHKYFKEYMANLYKYK